MEPRRITAAEFVPTMPRTGSGGSEAWRLENLLLRGIGERHQYWECLVKEQDLHEDTPLVALTGTVAVTIGSDLVTGTGTLFLTECHVGQSIIIIPDDGTPTIPIFVKHIISDTEYIAWRPSLATLNTQIGWRMYGVQDLDNRRCQILWGSVIRNDRGTLLHVGDGPVFIDGQALNAPLTLSRRPGISIYDPAADTYAHYPLGMNTPAAPTLSAVAGGTKDMQAGNYSVVLVSARVATGGYNNPSVRADVTIATGDMIGIDFPLRDAIHGQDAWIPYVTQYRQSLGTDLGHLNGPWFKYGLIPITDLTGGDGGTFNIEYYDGEVGANELLTFNNDPPTEAEFVKELPPIPVWISCQGPGRSVGIASAANANPVVFTTSNPHGLVSGQEVLISGATGGWTGVNGRFIVTVISPTTFSIPADSTAFGALSGTLIVALEATAPGPFVVPAKPSNVEAAPLGFAYPTAGPETIIGSLAAAGRIYLLTTNHLHIAQGTADQNLPVIVRPFWKDGFARWDQLIFNNGNLYAYTAGGPTQSVGDGDLIEAEKEWAGKAAEFMDKPRWTFGHAFVQYWAKRDAVCYFHAAHSLNEQGFWTTEVMIYGLPQRRWIGRRLLSDPERDRIVSGAAVIGEDLVLSIGGRKS